MSDVLTRLQTALADRYTVEGEVGRGGMATVYLARDRKLDRRVAIKVLAPEVSEAVGAERFLREIKITAQLTHPNILGLIDSGEADGLLFYVMPYVEGESLRDRLRREKLLPIDDALQIAKEVADALASAHSQGIVHRDIKPENILLEEGHAVVADFGIARAITEATGERITETGLSVGTPGYMSPEQAAGEPADARSDIYSLGCVLFEMLGGDPPYTGATPQAILARKITEPIPKLRTVRETVPEALEQTIERALAKVPADRFATATEFREWLSPERTTAAVVVARRSTGKPRGLWAGAFVAVAVIVGIVVVVSRGEAVIDFGERDWVLIADLENHTGDDVFDRSLLHALTVAIDQSQYVNVYPRNRVHEVLRRMQRDSVVALDEVLSLEVAQRENIDVVLVPAISELGGRYLLTTRLVDPTNGVTVQSRQAEAADKSAVLDGLGELAQSVRRDLGESLRQIRQRAVPLPRATTTSLEGLKLYADGSFAWTAGRWEEARTLWSRAVALDSGFAWANASLGLANTFLGGREAGRDNYDRALSLLDRVTEKERLWITGLASEGEDAVDAYQAYVLQYPDERDAWYNLGNMLRFTRRLEEGVDAYLRALAIDSMQPWVHTNLGVTYDNLIRFDEAAHHFERAFAIAPDGAGNWRGDVNRISGFVLLKIGDTTAARERFALLLSGDNSARANGLRSMGLLKMYHGQHRDARALLEEAVVLNQQAGFPLSEYRNRMYLARLHRTTGDTTALRAELTASAALNREGNFGPAWEIHLALHRLALGDVEAAREYLDAWIADGVEQGSGRWRVEFLRGEIALVAGRTADAVEALERANDLGDQGLVLDALARARWANGSHEEAAVAFEEEIQRRELGWEPQEAWTVAHYRLGVLLAEMGDAERSQQYLGRFLELWGEAENLEMVRDARRRIGRD